MNSIRVVTLSWPRVTPKTVTAVDSASGDISPFPAPPNALET
jgi:hypothetical protein